MHIKLAVDHIIIKKCEVITLKKEKIVDVLSIPKDIALGTALITITGTYEVYIQNFMGLIEYTDKKVRIQTKSGKVIVIGARLHIEYFTNDDIRIKGYIMEVKLDNSEV